MRIFEETVQKICAVDKNAIEAAEKRLDYLLKPKGSLGKLEWLARRIAGITGKTGGTFTKRGIVVMCADNGVYEEGIASSPQNLSALVADCMLRGLSGVAVLGAESGASLHVVDVGLVDDPKEQGIVNRKIRRGTDSIMKGNAMSREEAIRAIEIGIEETAGLIDSGYDLIGTGEVGMGNTTTSSALLYALSGCGIDEAVGRGAGLTDEAFAHKKEVVREAVRVNHPDCNDPVGLIAALGGFDIAGLVGVFLACAAHRVPVVIDGVISGAAAVIAARIAPLAIDYMLPSHGTEEPGGVVIKKLLGLEPMLMMNMRLGEGTGCALAFHLIDAAMAMIQNMGTFGDIG